MKRLAYLGTFLVALVLIVAVIAHHSPAMAPVAFPQSVSAWILLGSATCTTPVPDRLQIAKVTNAAVQVCTGQYLGSPQMSLTVYSMRSSSSAFEAVQRWEVVPNQTVFYKGANFGVVRAQGADAKTLGGFAVAVQTELPGE